MKGRCDVPYGKFHADLALYSLTREGYCQVYNRNPFLEDLTPADGTLLQGSQHVFESLGDRYASNLDEYGWDQQNFPGTAFFYLPFPLSSSHSSLSKAD